MKKVKGRCPACIWHLAAYIPVTDHSGEELKEDYTRLRVALG
jgi:hypothetical protein